MMICMYNICSFHFSYSSFFPVVLGYDEIFAILRSPMLLFFLIITVGGVYILHQLGLIGPIKVVFIGVDIR